MRSTLFATVATFGLTLGVAGFGGAAMAQTTNDNMAPMTSAPMTNAPMSGAVMPGHSPGVGLSEPASTQASNISASDTHSTIAPRLPGAAASGVDETTAGLLRMAERDLSEHRTGAAQEALERAETRMLDRSTPAGMTDTPTANPIARTIAQAREALGHNDLAGARSLVAKAMAAPTAG